jgi:hypothetical protein
VALLLGWASPAWMEGQGRLALARAPGP